MRRFRFWSRLLQARFVAALVLAAAIVLLSMVLALVLFEERLFPSDVAPSAAASANVGERDAAAAAKIDARMEAAAMGAQALRRPEMLPPASPFEVVPPLRSIDAASFRDGGRIVRLAGVEAPRANDVCLDGGERWSCGLQARAALHNIVANRSLFCRPISASTDGGIMAVCRLDAKGALSSGDVAHLLVRQGWVRSVPETDAVFAVELAEAKAAGAGLWRGAWRIVTP